MVLQRFSVQENCWWLNIQAIARALGLATCAAWGPKRHHVCVPAVVGKMSAVQGWVSLSCATWECVALCHLRDTG